MSKHKNWFAELTQGDSELAASKKSGVTTSTLNRQLSKGVLSSEVVILLARGYGQNPIEALTITGYITHEEAAGMSATGLAQLIPDSELLKELARRIDSTPGAWSDVFLPESEENITPVSDLESHRQALYEREIPQLDYDSLPADSSPIEPEPGDDGYNEL